MGDFGVVINFPNREEFGAAYEQEISLGGVFVNTPLNQPDMGDPVVITFRVHGVEGDLCLRGTVVQVTDMSAPQGMGVAVALDELIPYQKSGIEEVIAENIDAWPEELDDEATELLAEIEARIERARTRDVLTDLGLGDDPRLADIDLAFAEFTKAFHPDRFASRGSPVLTDKASTLFALTKKATDRLRSEADRAARIKEAVRQKVAEQEPVEPSKSGTTSPFQQARVAHEVTQRRRGTRPVPRPETGPVSKPDPAPATEIGPADQPEPEIEDEHTAPSIELVTEQDSATGPHEVGDVTQGEFSVAGTGDTGAIPEPEETPRFGAPPAAGFDLPDPEPDLALSYPDPADGSGAADEAADPDPAAAPTKRQLSPAMQRAIARRKAKAMGRLKTKTTTPVSEPEPPAPSETPAPTPEPRNISPAVARAIAKRKAKQAGQDLAADRGKAKKPAGTGPKKRRPRLSTGSLRANLDPLQEAAQGKLELRRKSYTKAKQAFARAVLADPDSAEFLSLLGRATFLENRDSHDEARKLLEKAAKLDPDYEWPYVYLGQMAKILDDPKGALAHFRRALMINPRSHEAQLEVKVLERRGSQRPAKSADDDEKKPKGKATLFGGLFKRGKKK